MGLEGPGPALQAAAEPSSPAVPAQAVPRFLRPSLARLLCLAAASRASRDKEFEGPPPFSSACTQTRRSPRVDRDDRPSAPGYPRADSVVLMGSLPFDFWNAHRCSTVGDLGLANVGLEPRTYAHAMMRRRTSDRLDCGD